MAKKKPSKQRRYIARELNSLIKQLPEFENYTIIYQSNNLSITKHNRNSMLYTSQLVQVGETFGITCGTTNLQHYKKIENEKHYLAKLISKYEEDITKQKNKCHLVSNFVNQHLKKVYFNLIDLDMCELIILNNTYNMKIDGNTLIKHLETKQFYKLMSIVIETTKKRQIDITQYLKTSITTEYLIKTKAIVKNDKDLQNIIDKIKISNELLTNDVINFIKYFQNAKQNAKIAHIPKQIKTSHNQQNHYQLLYTLGKIYKARFTSIGTEPYQPEITIDNTLLTQLEEIIIFASAISTEKIEFYKQYYTMQQKHNTIVQTIIKEKNAGQYGTNIANQALRPKLTLTIAPNYDLEYCYKQGKQKITDLKNPEQMKLWVNTCRQDFKQSELAIASKIENALKNINTKLSEPTTQAILIIIRDTQNKGLKALVDILRGSKSAAIYKHHYDKHPSYGKLAEYKCETVENMIEELIRMDFIKKKGYRNKYNVYCTSFSINNKIIQQLDNATKHKNVDIVPQSSLKNSIVRLQKLKQITINDLVPPISTFESDKDLQKIVTFFKTAKCNANAEEALLLYFADAISAKWSPFFMLNSKMETGKAVKRLKTLAELLKAKEVTP